MISHEGGSQLRLKKIYRVSLLISRVPLALCVTGFSADPSVIRGRASKSDLMRPLKSKKMSSSLWMTNRKSVAVQHSSDCARSYKARSTVTWQAQRKNTLVEHHDWCQGDSDVLWERSRVCCQMDVNGQMRIVMQSDYAISTVSRTHWIRFWVPGSRSSNVFFSRTTFAVYAAFCFPALRYSGM